MTVHDIASLAICTGQAPLVSQMKVYWQWLSASPPDTKRGPRWEKRWRRGRGKGEAKEKGRWEGKERTEVREDRGKRGQGEADRKSRWRGKGERSRGRGKKGRDIILLTTLHHNYITHFCSDCAITDKLNKCLHHLTISSQRVIPGKIVPQNNTISLRAAMDH